MQRIVYFSAASFGEVHFLVGAGAKNLFIRETAIKNFELINYLKKLMERGYRIALDSSGLEDYSKKKLEYSEIIKHLDADFFITTDDLTDRRNTLRNYLKLKEQFPKKKILFVDHLYFKTAPYIEDLYKETNFVAVAGYFFNPLDLSSRTIYHPRPLASPELRRKQVQRFCHRMDLAEKYNTLVHLLGILNVFKVPKYSNKIVSTDTTAPFIKGSKFARVPLIEKREDKPYIRAIGREQWKKYFPNTSNLENRETRMRMWVKALKRYNEMWNEYHESFREKEINDKLVLGQFFQMPKPTKPAFPEERQTVEKMLELIDEQREYPWLIQRKYD